MAISSNRILAMSIGGQPVVRGYDNKLEQAFNVELPSNSTRFVDYSAVLYDHKRSRLYCMSNKTDGTKSSLNCYTIEDNNISLLFTLKNGTDNCNINCISLDEKTGIVYRVYSSSTANANGVVVDKIDPEQQKIVGTMTYPLPPYSRRSINQQICVVSERNEVYIRLQIYPYIGHLDYYMTRTKFTKHDEMGKIRLIKTDLDLQGQEMLLNEDAHVHPFCYGSGSFAGLKNTTLNCIGSTMEWNSVSKKLLMIDSINGNDFPYCFKPIRVFAYDPVLKRETHEYGFTIEDGNGYDELYKTDYISLFIGKVTGTVFIRRKDGYIYKFTPDLRFVSKFKAPDESADITSPTGFDPYREIFYLKDFSKRQIKAVSGIGDVLNVNTLDADFKYCHVCYVESQAPSSVASSLIVKPVNGSNTTDATPTVVFKVGANPVGYTQQFRLVLDKDENKIYTGTHSTAYDRVLDSWTDGDHYVDATWEYSTDYNPETDTGTFAPLGKEVGKKEGGVTPTNGINADSTVHYVRLTIPDSLKLDNANIANWYLKVFSYTKS